MKFDNLFTDETPTGVSKVFGDSDEVSREFLDEFFGGVLGEFLEEVFTGASDWILDDFLDEILGEFSAECRDDLLDLVSGELLEEDSDKVFNETSEVFDGIKV